MTGMGGPDLERIIEDSTVEESSNENSETQQCEEDGDKEGDEKTPEQDVEQHHVSISPTESPEEGDVNKDIFKEDGVEIDLSSEDIDIVEPQNQDLEPLKENAEFADIPRKVVTSDNDLTESSKIETSLYRQNMDDNGTDDVTDAARTEEISRVQNNYKDDNVVTVELALKNEHNSPEVVINPKFVKKPFNGEIASQKIRAVSKTSSYRPLSSEVRLTSQTQQKTKKRSFCDALKFWTLLTLFTAFVFGYAVGGAYLFSHLEKEREMVYNARIDKWKNDTAILLATELRQVKPYEEVWARKIFHHLELYEKDLLKASAVGYRREDHEDRGQRWTWTSSLFFSISLMTTTGYGPMTPRSEFGRLAVVFYSFFGIPLALSWFITIGYLLATSWISLFENICCRLCNEKFPDTELEALPSTNHKQSLKVLRVRSNSIVPEEEKLISKTDTRLKNSSKVCRKVISEKTPQDFVNRNNYAAKNQITFQKRINKTESAQFQGVYHTMDYAISIIYAFLFFVVYFIFCSILFAIHEQWALTDVLYFSYLFFLTLGPGCHELEDDGAEIKIKNNILYTIHMCVGYCILAMIVNLFFMMLHGKTKSRMEERQDVFDSLQREKF